MTGTTAIKKFVSIASDSASKLKRIGTPFWRVLTFSPADDRILPQKALCASIEKGGLSVVFGSRFLSKIKIKGFRRYPFEEDKYPQPEGIASSLALAVNNFGAIKADVTLTIPKAWAVIIKPYLDALKERGINIRRLTVSLSSIGTLCSYFDKEAGIIFLELHENQYEGGLLLDGSVTETFTGSFSSKDYSLRADTILSEITPLADVAKTKGGSPQIVVLMKGNGSDFKDILKLKVDLPDKIFNETDIKIKSPVSQKEISYAALGGVIEYLWPKAKGLNLLKKGLHERQKTPFALTVVLMLIIFAMLVIYMVAPLRVEKKRLWEIDNQINLRKEDVKKVEALKKDIETLNEEVSTIRNFKGKSPMALDLIRELTTILPKTTWLTRLKF